MPPPLIGIAAGLSILPAIGAITDPYIEFIRQQAYVDQPVKILTPQELSVAARRSLRDYPALESIARRSGINEAQFRLLVDLNRTYLAPDQYIASMRRGFIDRDEAADSLGRIGLEARDRGILHELSEMIPPVSDLITMAVKGAFSEEEISRFKLDAQFPEEVAEWAAKQGLSREWALNYWRSHWQLPSPLQVFEMLHRGVIEEDTLDIYLKAADYSTFWRDGLKKISYNPLTRVDTRRLRKDGIIDRDQVFMEYRNQGYDDTRAEWLTEWTENDVKREKRVELKDLTDGLRTVVLNGVVAGSFTEEEGTSYLEAMGYEAEEITDFIMYARTIREEKIRLRIIERVGDLYVKERATETEVRSYMAERGFQEAEIALRLEEWNIEREIKAPSESAEKERDLTKADIIGAYKDSITTRDDAKTELVAMRYSADEAERLLAAADHDLAVVIQKEEIEVVKNGVLRGRIDEVTAATKLDVLGVRATQRDSLTSSWFRQVESRVFDLPLSMVLDMFTRNIIVADDAKDYLGRLGANALDTQRVLALWGDKKSKAELAAQLAAAKKKV